MDSEKEFLSEYNIEDFDRPSVTSDIVILTMRSQKECSYRHDPNNRLSILLIKRGQHPYKDCWALPGGFISRGETIEECALREVKEETNILPSALLPTGVYSEDNRDPRGWIISNAFTSVISSENINPKGGDDASDARWFDLSFEANDSGEYMLLLTNSDIKLVAVLKETKRSFGTTSFEIVENSSLAFDHAKIIASSLSTLRSRADNPQILFDFLPEKFTFAELQRVYETITNETVLTANFRRKMSVYVEPTEETTTGAGHRPAQLFRQRK